MKDSVHISVLPNEVSSYLEHKNKQILILDCTLGGGGHTKSILSKNENNYVIGLDCDEEAIKRNNVKFKEESRLFIKKANFSEISKIFNDSDSEVLSWIKSQGFEGFKVDAILADLGLSSDQLDDSARGFSFSQQGPLDMRANSETSLTADDVVNSYTFAKLKSVFERGGVGKNSKRFANAILNERPIKDTKHLADVISRSNLDKSKNTSHPATVVFQAIRIEVNSEFSNLKTLLDDGFKLLKDGGRFLVISFHSTEDLFVTRKFRELERKDDVLSKLPIEMSNIQLGKLITRKAIRATSEEVNNNPRSRSALLRVFEKSNSNKSFWEN